MSRQSHTRSARKSFLVLLYAKGGRKSVFQLLRGAFADPCSERHRETNPKFIPRATAGTWPLLEAALSF